MARKKKTKRREPNRRRKQPPQSEESRAAEGVTVAWMLAALGAGATELVALLTMAALAYEPLAAALPEQADFLPWMLLFVALITGTIALILTPVVIRQRQTPPPNAIVNFALFVGVVAWTLAIGSIWLE